MTQSTQSFQSLRPLVVVSSKTGNTRLAAHALVDAFPGARLVAAEEFDTFPEPLETFDTVFLGFWCDRGLAPEGIVRAAARLEGKRIGCFATMGGDPTSEKAIDWMRRTSEALAAAGRNNTLVARFLCRGRIDPALFGEGYPASPEREARRLASETHPDRLDLLWLTEAFQEAFGEARVKTSSDSESATNR